MNTPNAFIRVGLCLSAAAAIASLTLFHGRHQEGTPSVQGRARPSILRALGNLPLAFEANRGQASSGVHFIARARQADVFFTSRSAIFALKDRAGMARFASFELSWSAAGEAPQGVDELTGRVNYFLGNRPPDWRVNVPIFSRITYSNFRPQVDLVYYGKQREIEYDLVVHPGGDPEAIQLSLEGVDSTGIGERGELTVSVAGHLVQFLAPTAYQTNANGAKREVPVEYAMLAPKRVGFRLGRYDPSLPLVIDPVIVFATYLGGTEADDAAGIALDTNGNIYVAGSTASLSFPTANPRQGTFGGVFDAFVAKFDPSGSTLVYATYLGGSDGDYALGLAVDSSGNAYVTGYTFSTNFPTFQARQGSSAGGWDAFVTKLNPSGSALLYSTYLGGSGDDFAYSIAVDGSGSAYVAGGTSSTNFPTASAIQGTLRGPADAFISKLSASGSTLMYSTYLGGTLQEVAYGIAVDSSGAAYITGFTGSTNFPTQNPFQAASGGTADAFVAKLSPAGSSLVYSTYLGGAGQDFGQAIAVDGSGNAYVVGQTSSDNFPTLNPIQASRGGGTDGFVSALNASGNGLVFSTWLGGSGSEYLYGVAVDATGNVSVVGETSSANFPTAAPTQAAGGGLDAVVVKLADAGTSFTYSTYFGGSQDDSARAVAVDNAGNAYIAGRTTSTDFPVVGALQSGNAGRMDGFVAKIGSSTALLLSRMDPNSGTTAGGTAIAISGSNFAAPATVTLGGVPAIGVNVVSGGQITARTGAHDAGVVDVVVRTADGGQTATLASGFTYVDPTTNDGGSRHRGGCGPNPSTSSLLAALLVATYFLRSRARRP